MTLARCVLAAVLLVAIADSARAQESALASGRSARAAGDHAAALADFTSAWDATAAPIARAEMASEELALGRFALAETHASEALAFADDPEIAARATSITETRDTAAAHLGSVEVRCALGCVISIDGERVGTTPLPHLVRAEAGAHAVHAELSGYLPADTRVDVSVGAVARATLDPVWIDDRPILERIGGTGDGQRIAGWIAVSAGGIALVIGAVALGVELDHDASLRSDACAPASPAESRESRCPDAASSRATYTDVARALLVSAAVLGVAGIVLLLTAPSAPASPSLSCAPTLAPGFACQGTF